MSAQLVVTWLAGAVLLLVAMAAFLACTLRAAVRDRRDAVTAYETLAGAVSDVLATAEAHLDEIADEIEEPVAPPGGA